MDELQLLRKKLERERQARKQAEAILEKKALELFHTNEELRKLNERLGKEVAERTHELQRSETRYRQIIETATDLIYRTDPEGLITYANPVASEQLGYAPEEIIGRHFSEFIPESHRQEVADFYWHIREQLQERSYQELPLLTRSGEHRWIGQNVQLLLEDGQLREVTAVARDITARKQTEQDLIATQTRLTALIANLQSGILVENEAGRIVLVNRHFCQLFQIPAPPEQLTGYDCALAAQQAAPLFEDPELFTSRIQEILTAQTLVAGEEWKLRDGNILERDYIPIFAEGRYLGHLWQYRDVTEKRRAQERLRRSEEKYRGIMENMELGLMEVDTEHRILRAYDLFCEMTGYEKGELEGRNALEVFLPEGYRELMDRQDENRRRGQTGVYEVQLRKKDGSLMWALISGAPIFDETGKLTGSIGIHYDITDRKQLEEDLSRAKQAAEAAQQAEQQFLARMSHEIRTPLNAIIGMAHLLTDTHPTPEQKEYLNVLKSSSDILQGLISDVLDFSKIQAGQIEITPRPFDLPGLARSIQRTFQLRLENQPVDILLELDPQIDTYLEGDDLLLNQILFNLMGNAVKFTEIGNIRLDISFTEKTGDRCRLRFRLSDTGIGIAEDRLHLVFENFKQAHSHQKHQFQGTGLGLPIAKQLVEMQGGNMEVSSRLGQGSTFTFELPYRNIGRPLADPSPAEEESMAFAPDQLSVLVAEDNAMNRKYISSLLQKWQIQHHLAHDGKQALDASRSRRYDLIFMDVSMPEMDGFDATIALRNSANPNRQTPIIALTASALRDKREKALALGMTDFLPKPFKPDQLRDIIRKYTHPQPGPEDETHSSFTFHPDLDTDFLRDCYEDDLEYALDMFRTFLQHTPPLLQELSLAARAGDARETARLAHQLKPTFSMVGLTKLTRRMEQLEAQAEHKADAEVLSAETHSMMSEYESLHALIEAEAQRLQQAISTQNKPTAP